MNTLPSLAVANFFVSKAHQEGREITPMKVIKLTYIAHGWKLGLEGNPLIRESIEAWKYGPVIRSLYDVFRAYGSGAIKHLASSWTPGGFGVVHVPAGDANIPLLDRIWQVYGHFTGGQLSTLTHQEDTPWHDIWEHEGGKNVLGAVIPDDKIREHYEQKRNG